MNTAQERAVITAIVRPVVRVGVAVFLGSFITMLVAWASESLGLLGGWAFMHSAFAFPTLIGAIALTFWATGYIPYLKQRTGDGDAV